MILPFQKFQGVVLFIFKELKRIMEVHYLMKEQVFHTLKVFWSQL